MIRWFILVFSGVLVLVSGLVCLILAIAEPRNIPLLVLGCVLVFLSLRLLEWSYDIKSKPPPKPQSWPKGDPPKTPE